MNSLSYGNSINELRIPHLSYVDFKVTLSGVSLSLSYAMIISFFSCATIVISDYKLTKNGGVFSKSPYSAATTWNWVSKKLRLIWTYLLLPASVPVTKAAKYSFSVSLEFDLISTWRPEILPSLKGELPSIAGLLAIRVLKSIASPNSVIWRNVRVYFQFYSHSGSWRKF